MSKDKVIKKVKSLLEDVSIKKVGQNLKYDYIVLLQEGINLQSMEDTMLISYTLDAGLNRHNLNLLSEIHLNHKTISYKDLVGSGKSKLEFVDVDLKEATKYAGEDADITLRLFKLLKDRVDKEKLNKIYYNFELPMIKLLSKMEINGIKIDDKYLKNLSQKFDTRIKETEKKIFKLAGKTFNIGSPKQLGEIIYNDLKIAKLKKQKRKLIY